MTGFLLDRDGPTAAENPQGSPRVHAWIQGVPDSDLYISSVNVMEARKGFARLRAKASTTVAINAIHNYEEDFDALMDSYDGRILAIDRAVAERWGEMLAERGTNVLDTAVAAMAAVRGLVVATRNIRHFRNRGVRLLDPFKVPPMIEGTELSK